VDNKRLDWYSLGQLVLALLGIIALWGLSLAIIAAGFIQLLSQGPSDAVLSIFMIGVPFAALGLLVLPSVYYPLMRLLGKEALDSRPILHALHPALWILGFPIVLLAGYLVSQNLAIAWLFLPPLHVLAIGLPVFWLLYLAIRKLPTGSSQRMWGVFNSGLILAPLFIMIFELLAGIVFVILAAAYVSTQPDLMRRLMALAEQMRNIQDQEALIQALTPFLVKPLVILGVVAFVSVVVPLIEEFFKPIGVWLLAGRKMGPAAGFAAGALSGAGYGFVESLVLINSGQDWASLVIARGGTLAVHMLTTSLTGFALVQAWQKRRFLRLVLAYLTAVLIHGTWNGLTIFYSFKTLAEMKNLDLQLPLANAFGTIAPLALVSIALACFLGLIAANEMLQRKSRHRPPQPVRVEGGEEQTGESVL
jgi:hypothetical protein